MSISQAIETVELQGAGVAIAADVAGPAHGQPLLFLPGSGQTRQSWRRALIEGARRGYRGIAVDLRGHGDSDWSPDGHYDVSLFVDDLRAILTQIPGRPIVIGASLGGIVAMSVAGSAPGSITALVLVDVTPRIEREGVREVIDFMGGAEHGFASLDEAADAVAAYLPHRQRPSDTSGLARNLRERDGRFYWHWDPRFMSMNDVEKAKVDGPNLLAEAARSLTIPTLLVRGGRSRIVTEEGAREFQNLVPHAEIARIPEADHMVAGDANDAFNGAVFDFVDRLAAGA